MQKTRKRKQQQQQLDPDTRTQTKPTKTSNDGKDGEPYPAHPRPTPEECLSIRDSLLALHGFPEEFATYRQQRLTSSSPDDQHPNSSPLTNGGDAHCGLDSGEHSHSTQESVLDGLVKTVLSQNTTEVNSQRAFDNLKSAFPTWEDVLAAESKCLQDAIRCGGLAPTKSSCIKNILSCLMKRKGKLCLEYLQELSVDEIKAELSCFKGIGPKTVFEIARTIGWVPAGADRNKTYLHLNHRIPDELKFDLNCLIYTHGKLCHKCGKKGANKKRKESDDKSCPLLNSRIFKYEG